MSKKTIKNCPARVLFTDGYFCRQTDGNILCERNFRMKKYVARLCDTAILELNEKEFEDKEEIMVNYNGNRTRCKCILVNGQCEFFVLYPKNMFDIQEVE